MSATFNVPTDAGMVEDGAGGIIRVETIFISVVRVGRDSRIYTFVAPDTERTWYGWETVPAGIRELVPDEILAAMSALTGTEVTR